MPPCTTEIQICRNVAFLPQAWWLGLERIGDRISSNPGFSRPAVEQGPQQGAQGPTLIPVSCLSLCPPMPKPPDTQRH
jgi:hypothetical protein